MPAGCRPLEMPALGKSEVETTVISVLALSSPVPEAKYLANPSVLEPALKVEPVSTVSVLAASQLSGGLAWYDAGSDWGFSIDFRARAGISSGKTCPMLTSILNIKV